MNAAPGRDRLLGTDRSAARLILFAVEGFTHDEIAAITDASWTTCALPCPWPGNTFASPPWFAAPSKQYTGTSAFARNAQG